MDSVLSHVYRVACHTRNVGLGSVFVAIPGARVNGNIYIPRAIEKGASRIVIETGSFIPQWVADCITASDVAVDYVSSARHALACYSALYYNTPPNGMHIIGITGTKGKTTCANLLEHIFRWNGTPVAVLSSVGNRINGTWLTTGLTTPQPDYIHAFLHTCKLHGVRVVVMEVAAQAISLHRIDGIVFDSLIITNISKEHGEFYPEYTTYRAEKARLLEFSHANTSIYVNADDTEVASMAPKRASVQYYGFTDNAVWKGEYSTTLHHESCVYMPAWDTHIRSTLPGLYNAYNVLATSVCAYNAGVTPKTIAQAHRHLPGIPGRAEEYQLSNGGYVCLDSAHNEQSFEAVLSMLHERFSYVIAIFGCGGDRDSEKRPEMGRIASMYAHHIILTPDNPRSEDPDDIMVQIKRGINANISVTCMRDREYAITWACQHIVENGVVAVLGKGRETEQVFHNVSCSYSDYTTIMRCLSYQ